jgi:16S rRNA (cytidine1402-2'-O)-methyltransferase
MGTLYVVGTPIGNLEDISLRALRVLAEVDFIMAEDTRAAHTLLKHHDVSTPVTSFHDFTAQAKVRRLVARIDAGENAAMISEAGMPGISDPGYAVIREALAAGCEVTCVPGPSAVPTALVLSGLPAHAFHYVGFLPRKAGERTRLLAALAEEPDTIICFESPHRLMSTLKAIAETFGDSRPMAAARELTKHFEEVTRGTVAEIIGRFEADKPRGEFTLVLQGTGARAAATEQKSGKQNELASGSSGDENQAKPRVSRYAAKERSRA